MSTYIWSVRIFAGDHAAQVTETVTAGLYNVQSDLSGNAAADQKVVNVDDGTLFQRADDATLPKCPKVLIQDDSHSEEAVIVSISGNALTMRDNLTNAYTTAAHAKVIADSEFRWTQNAVPSLSETWRDDMLVPGGIGKIIHLLDLSDGGNTATVNGLEVTIKNVDLFWNTLFSTLDLSLIGARAEIVLFTDTTETVKWYGICEKPKWDRRTYTIPMRGTWKKRSVNITTEQNVEGKDEKIVIPATFGEWKDAPAMLVRTVSSETTQSLFGILYDMVSVYGAAIANFVNLEIVGRKIFPIVAAGASPSLTYDIQFGTAAEIDFLDFGTLDFSDLDLFLYICEDESAQGVYRHIESIDYKSGTAITITVSCYYKTDPTASAGATEAWVKIINLAREYESDVWPHKAFIDEQGAEITAGINLYTYSDDSRVTISGDPSTAPITSPVEKRQIGFYLLPSYAYEIESGDTDYNRLIINPELVESNIDKISSFIIKPVINPRLLNLSTADARSVWGFGSTITKINAGLYGTIPNDLTITTDSGAFADTIDKDHTSNIQITIAGTTSTISLLCVLFDLPAFPENFEPDAIYVGVYLTHTKPSAGQGIFSVNHRRFVGGATSVIAKTIPVGQTSIINDSLPDFYYESARDTDERYFFPETDGAVVGSDYCFSGYGLYEITSITDRDIYDAIEEMLLYCQMNIADSYPTTYNLYELAVLFAKTLTITDKIYTNLKARIFNDTWGGRATSANLMESPRDIFEALCRMQCYDERGTMPSGGWGKGYCSEALIKIAGTGNFDALSLDYLDEFKVARQITEYDDGWTDDLKRSLCREFFMANYIDENGYECLLKVPTSEDDLETPTDLITFADIRAAESLIEIEEPDPAKIYCEPFVRYNKNMATGEYESIIAVHNITARNANGTAGTRDGGDLCYAATEEEKATKGWVEDPDGALGSGEGEQIWESCNHLYEISGIINEPPEEMTDLQWANGNLTNAKAIAKHYLLKWIDWMRLKKCRFMVNFLCAAGGGTVVHQWHEGHRFLLQLPHETNNVEIECIATKIAIDPNPPYHVEIEAYMLESAKLEPDYLIYDTYDSNQTQWQDTYNTVAEDPVNTDEDIQDEY